MNQGSAVVSLLPTIPVAPSVAGTKAERPPAPSTSALLSGCRAPALVKAATQVVPSWGASGPTPLAAAALSLVRAVPQSTRVALTVMLGCSALKAAISSFMYCSGWAPLGLYQNSIETLGWLLS